MTVYYVKPDEAQTDLLFEAMQSYHQRLHNIGVTVGMLMVHDDNNNDDTDREFLEPALKHHGVPALGVTRVMPLKMRAHGLADAEILIDGDAWKRLAPSEQLAVLDHELTHIEPLITGKGDLKRDDLGRPKLEIRLHDHQFGWFTEVAERHGRASQEVQQAKLLYDEGGQAYFEFAAQTA